MGLDYTIRTYTKKENLSKVLVWLGKNSWANQEKLTFYIGHNQLYVNGHELKIDGKKAKDNDCFISANNISFLTSLIFDIDSEIVASFEDDFFPDFEHLAECILENGKIRVGGFDCYISESENSDFFQISLHAVTSKMSIMLARSQSVKRWIIEFSIACEAILSFVDQESSERIIYFYNGKSTHITIPNDFDEEDKKDFKNLLGDYFELGT
ncbi:MAG: hypothetical protein CFE23_16720 [Flavobacterium sp. BFFFF1]|uniref:hypothetical protein n=1 Tax=Flavobacterium sp. BFFFF1 TaxID=2015557 RepID=UPI000BD1CF42|nr:hypothetical protein [Flavobacterium sp. BFFFF1]OYU78834.1 MAG: hypothetical protein CFE23_16720 [Flavobacterium sp. BFFFF1]